MPESEAIESLSPTERRIYDLRHPADGERMTMPEIAALFHVDAKRIRQIYERTKRKLAKAAKESGHA